MSNTRPIYAVVIQTKEKEEMKSKQDWSCLNGDDGASPHMVTLPRGRHERERQSVPSIFWFNI